MGDVHDEFPHQDQRTAVCFDAGRRRGRKDEPSMVTKTFAMRTRAAAMDPLECEVTLSTDDIDREGDVVSVAGWHLDAYRRNPVVLAHHDHKSLPVARMDRLTVVGDKLVGRLRFPEPGISARADEVRGLVKAGFVSGVSVGFRPIKAEPHHKSGGTRYLEQELLELLFVAIPANAAAMVTQKATRWGGDDLVDVSALLSEHTKAKPECPRAPRTCGFNAQLGYCAVAWNACPMTQGIPTKGGDSIEQLAERLASLNLSPAEIDAALREGFSQVSRPTRRAIEAEAKMAVRRLRGRLA